MSSNAKRLFIALPFTREAVDSLVHVEHELRIFREEIKTVDMENYHITIKFLGDVDRVRTERIIQSIHELPPGTGIVDFSLKGLGVFPSLHNASVIWAGLIERNGELKNLYDAVEGLCSALDFSRDKRSFKPHLTVARVRKGAVLPNEVKDYISRNSETLYCKSFFDRLVLFESRLTSGGPIYSEVTTRYLTGE